MKKLSPKLLDSIVILIWLAYLINPIDLIPDLFFPIVGWLDDAGFGIYVYQKHFKRLFNIK